MGLPLRQGRQRGVQRFDPRGVGHGVDRALQVRLRFRDAVQIHRSATLAQTVGAQVRCHPPRPCQNLRLALTPLRRDLPKPDQRFLDDILGFGLGPECPKGVRKKRWRQSRDEFLARRAIAIGESNKKRRIRSCVATCVSCAGVRSHTLMAIRVHDRRRNVGATPLGGDRVAPGTGLPVLFAFPATTLCHALLRSLELLGADAARVVGVKTLDHAAHALTATAASGVLQNVARQGAVAVCI